ncbi:MAG TPA: DedA family protein [Desulfuromonadaceae bacterium]|jgi:membrane protein DedA with SNARE-associated domain
MEQFQQILRDYLAIHGYWVLFIGTFLEGEAMLIMAGFLAFEGYLNISGVILTAFTGSFLGDQFYFFLGHFKGKALMRRFHSIVRKFRQALKLIEKYGALVAFISRYTYGFRIVLPIILGITNLPARTFLWINLISALSWAIIFSLIGYIFGKSASLLLDDVGRYEHYLLIILLLAITIIWLIHIYHGWKLQKPARDRLVRIKVIRANKGKINDPH